MIIIKLKGGLGNQLFQYSFGCYLSHKFSTEIKYDLNWYKNADFKFQLENLGLSINKCNTADYINIFGIYLHPRIAKKVNSKFSVETGFIKESDQYQFKDNKYYDGYWQDFKFVKGNLKFLKDQIFKAKDSISLDLIQNSPYPTVAIHIRGGDYHRSSKNLVLNVDYYRKSIESLLSRYENLSFFVFTNDIEHSKRIIGGIQLEDYKLISNPDPIKDFLKMTTCQHYIIANSTYSWWAAVLGKESDSLVCAPSKWLTTEKNKSDDKKILEDWFVF